MTDQRGSVFVGDAPDTRLPMQSPDAPPAPVSLGDVVSAHYRQTVQGFVGAPNQAEMDGYGPIVTELTRGHEYGADGVSRYVYVPGQGTGGIPVNTDNVWADVQARRARDPSFLKDVPATDATSFAAWVKQRERDRADAAASTIARQSGIVQRAAGFATDIGVGLADPINLSAMILTAGAGGATGSLVRTMARDALINGAIEATELPLTGANRTYLGQPDMTAGEAAKAVGEAALGGAVFGAGLHLGGKAASVATRAALATPMGRAVQRAAVPFVLSRTDLPHLSDQDLVNYFVFSSPKTDHSLDEQAAIHVLDRQTDMDASNPYHPTRAGFQAHSDQLANAVTNVMGMGVRDSASPLISSYHVADGIGADGPTPEQVTVVRRSDGNTYFQRDDGQIIDIGAQIAAGQSIEQAIASRIGHDITGRNVTAVNDSVQTRSPASLSPARVIRFVMGDLEGGARVVHYSDADGGTTRYGIAARANPGVDVANLSAEQAASIARRKYWLPEYDRADPRTAAVAFDAGYISGPEVGRRILRDSGGDPEKALALYRGWLDHLADTVPGKERYRKGWNARVDKLARFVGGSDDRLALRPDAFADAGAGDDAVAIAQRELDDADMAAQLDAHDAALARADEADMPSAPASAPDVLEGSGVADNAGYFAPLIEGDAEQVVTPRGRAVDTRFEVREAADLIDSSSPAFDQRLQPRDRAGRSASDVQIARIAGDLDPAQLASSRLAGQGAPIVGPDGMVESGNGRVAAIRRAYAEHPERAAAYRAMVEGRHPDAAGMREPVLVRRRTAEMTAGERRAWVAEANERDTMGMAPEEQAGADARALTPEAMAMFRGGEVTDARNRPFVRAFLDQVAAHSDVNGLTDKAGSLNADGLQRINRAIVARAYENGDIVDKLSRATENNIKAIGDVLTRIAPAMAQLKDLIRAGRIDPQFDLSAALTELAQRVSHARDAGTPIDDVLRQGDMFGGGPDREVAALMRLFFRSEDRTGEAVLTRPRSADTVTDALEAYIAGARQGLDFFGEQPTAEELIYARRNAIAGDDEPSYTAASAARDGAADGGVGASGRGAGVGGDSRGPDGAARDEAEADGLTGPPPLDPRAGGIDDPNGDAARTIAASQEHDVRATARDDRQESGRHTAQSILNGQRGIDLDEAIRRAEENQPQLGQIGAALARDTGAEWHDPGIKGRARIAEKIASEGYADAGEIKDIARGALTISEMEQADEIVRRLSATHAVHDKGWQRLDTGYFDRKLIVRFDNGGVAELQIVPKAVWEAKKAELGALYERSRAPGTPAEESARLEQRQREGYAAALRGSGFDGIADTSASGKARAKAAGDSDTPSDDALLTSPGASRQTPPDQAQAIVREDSRATGRSSTSNSSSVDIDNASVADISDNGGLDNGAKSNPAIADRQRQESSLRAGSPLRNAAEQEGTGGLGLFDVADQPSFRLDDDSGERTLSDILHEIDTDQAAIDAARSCL